VRWLVSGVVCCADTSLGLWMLAFNVTFFEDMRLCTNRCHPYAVGFLNNYCSGLCDPINDMYRYHQSFMCRRKIPEKAILKWLPSFEDHEQFDAMKVY
jgi:hypothetical protein